MAKSNIDSLLCARLKQARISKDYRSGRAFALTHKIAVNTYLNHENGKRALSLEVVKRYAKLLKISYIWLLTGSGEMITDSDSALTSSTTADTEQTA